LNEKIPFIEYDGGTHSTHPIGTHLISIGTKGREALIRAYHNGLGRLSESFTPGK
jgi:hypothetical protein